MASYLDKVQINTAITDNTKLDLGCQRISTADFMQANVAYLHEMVPGEKIDINMETFARLNPLPVPTFGRASMIHRGYFVPFRTIFRGWNDFITDAVHIASDGYVGQSTSVHILSQCPTVQMYVLADVFRASIGTSSTDSTAMLYPTTDTAAYDVSWPGAQGYYNFTTIGRQAIKMLEDLGYKIDWESTDKSSIALSAMPLLALAKVYCDWMFPQQYSDISLYDNLLSMCNLDVANGPLQLSAPQARLILTACAYVQFDSDYFVSAWDQPNSPNTGNYSNFRINNIDSISKLRGYSANYGTTVDVAMNGYVGNSTANALTNSNLEDTFVGANAPFISPTIRGIHSGTTNTPVSTPISEYLLHSLHALTDYLKRHQLAGSRNFDRYLARFAKALPAEKLNRSVYLGAEVQKVQIGDIMSTADTEGANLGSFAGKGMTYGNAQFTYSTDEFGYIIIISSIVPASGYFQGIDRQVMRTTKLQYWTPEFDSLGSQSIDAIELYLPQRNGEMTTGNKYEQIFGFTPRYADYKVSHDRLTGNFRLMSLNGGSTINAADSWHLMRTFDGSDDFSSDWGDVVHSPDFISGYGDHAQFKRIFYNNEEDAPDNFTVINNFEIAAYAPMKALYDTYEFEDKGKQIKLDVNGVKHN